MALHPLIQQALLLARDAVPYHRLPLDQARAQARLGYPVCERPVAVAMVRNTVIPGPGGDLPVRIYSPPGNGPHPITVFFHGSGFVLLDLDTHDDLCRRLCAGATTMVVSVDYRLAPEHPFPAAVNDCLAATRWVAAHAGDFDGDAARIAVAGDSAGGCLALVTAMRLRDEGGPALRAQVLWYPVTDFPSVATSSYRVFATGFGLTDEGMRWFWQQYLPKGVDIADAQISPLRMASMGGLPPACVLVAECDVLRDEGEALAHRLAQDGVPVESRRYVGMNHGFLKYAGVLAQADAAIADACHWLAQRFQDSNMRSQKESTC